MTTRHRWAGRAFTLVELLIVIGILALLVAILMPSLARARTLARRLVCTTNVKDISSACVSYANDLNWHKNTLPTLPVVSGINSGNWGDPVNGNVACFWLLFTGSPTGSTVKVAQPWTSPGKFICPEATGRRGFVAPTIADGHFTVKTMSYGYLSQVAFTWQGHNNNNPIYGTSVLDVRSSTIIVADSNPHCTPGDSSWDGPNSPAVRSRFANSANHNGEGENIGKIDLSAVWTTTTVIDNDDFYRSDGGNNAGGVRYKNSGGVDESINDSFILP